MALSPLMARRWNRAQVTFSSSLPLVPMKFTETAFVKSVPGLGPSHPLQCSAQGRVPGRVLPGFLTNSSFDRVSLEKTHSCLWSYDLKLLSLDSYRAFCLQHEYKGSITCLGL